MTDTSGVGLKWDIVVRSRLETRHQAFRSVVLCLLIYGPLHLLQLWLQCRSDSVSASNSFGYPSYKEQGLVCLVFGPQSDRYYS